MKWPNIFNVKRSNDESVMAALSELGDLLLKKNIPVIMDDWDAGYALAIDEVLALINDAINKIASENDIDYSGGY